MGSSGTREWEGWTAVSAFTNSWANQGGGFPEAKYRKSVDGTHVEMTGMVTGGASGSSPFTLPAGYRPTTARYMVCANASSGGVVVLIIPPTGVFTINGGVAANGQVIDCVFAIDV